MRKFHFISGGILLAVIIYLLYLSLGSSVSYYVTVSEFYNRQNEFSDVNVRVAGKIVDNPIDWNAEDLKLSFTISEGGKNMAVIYHGTQPSGFKAGSNILVEGKYQPDGILQASQLILKCPSKYEPVE